MTSTTGGITLFTPQNPIVIRIEDLYNPAVTPPTGNIIPVVDCLVVDTADNNTIWIVTAVDPNTHASTLAPARMAVSNTNPSESLVSIISYGNDIFRVYYDVRTLPITVRPDKGLVVFGTDVVSYQLVQNPGPNQVVLSRHYDASGNYTGTLVPMAQVVGLSGTTHPGASYPTACNIQTPLTDGEEVFLEVFNSQGAQIALISAFAKQSIIINESITPLPIITGATILSNQTRSNNEIFIYQGQSISSLGIQVQLIYSNGYTRIVPIDQQKCYLYGVEDFVASYPGLQQTLIAKYFLDSDEAMSLSLAQTSVSFVVAESNLIVISNGLVAGVKISVVPTWNPATNQYNLNFFLYTTTRDVVINVTNLVTLLPSTPFNGAYYGFPQNITLQLDMHLVQPNIYPVSTIYQQSEIITLQPVSTIDRYVIKDTTTAVLTFGKTSTTIQRPAIHYDVSRQQYYIPSLFPTEDVFLQAFFVNANPPYDTTVETEPPTPTHFQFRDPSSGVLLTSAPIPISSYNTAVSIIGAGPANRYSGLGNNILVEFVEIIGSTTLILYGVPVDVFVGSYNG